MSDSTCTGCSWLPEKMQMILPPAPVWHNYYEKPPKPEPMMTTRRLEKIMDGWCPGWRGMTIQEFKENL